MEFKILRYKPELLKTVLSLLFLFCLSGKSNGSEIKAVVGHSSFFLLPSASSSTFQPFIDLYWEIDPKSLPFMDDHGRVQSRIKTDIMVRNDTGIIFEDHYILETRTKATIEEAVNQHIIELRRFNVVPGSLTIELRLADAIVNNRSFSYIDSVFVPPASGGPFYSDIQLIDTIIDSKETNSFRRNDQIQIPMCSNFISEGKRMTSYYAELYNARQIAKEEYPVIQKVFISKKGQDGIMHGLYRQDTITKREVNLVQGSFLTETLPSGNYDINIQLVNKLHQNISSQKLFFQLMNAHPAALKVAESSAKDSARTEAPTNYLNLNKTFAGKYSSSQVRAILKMLIPISDPTEKLAISGFLSKPDEMYMRYFIYNFWQHRDTKNPELAWKNYTEKVKEVNKLFGTSLTSGYESDRGMIYLKYGKPAEIIPVPNEEGALPYELWQYNATAFQGSIAIFLFYRPGFMVNDYKLLHSTAIGDLRNAAWRSVLYPGGQGSNKDDSKAEQYLGNK